MVTAVSPWLFLSCQAQPYQDTPPESHGSWGFSPSRWQSRSSTAHREESNKVIAWGGVCVQPCVYSVVLRVLISATSSGYTFALSFRSARTLISEPWLGPNNCAKAAFKGNSQSASKYSLGAGDDTGWQLTTPDQWTSFLLVLESCLKVSALIATIQSAWTLNTPELQDFILFALV